MNLIIQAQALDVRIFLGLTRKEKKVIKFVDTPGK